MKCAECGKSNATHRCIECDSWYCEKCTHIYEGHCDCQGPNIFTKEDYDEMRSQWKKGI